MRQPVAFLEFPTLFAIKRADGIRPALRNVFLSQCVDHALGLLTGIFFLALGLGLFEGSMSAMIAKVGNLFWITSLITLAAVSFLYRAFFTMLLGATLGNLLFRLKPIVELNDARFWFGQIFESLHLTFPALWLLDSISRASGYAIGIDYTTS